MKILFMHNSLPEYRFEFLRQLNKCVDMEILITHKEMERRLYGFVEGDSGFNEVYWDIGTWLTFPSTIGEKDIVILPPTDSVLDFFISLYVLTICKLKCVRTVLWSESWFRWKQLLHPVKAIKIVVGVVMKIIVGNGVDRLIVPGEKAYNYMTCLPIRRVKEKTYIAIDSSTSPTPPERFVIREKYNIPDTSRIVLFLGRMLGFKGLSVLVKAADELIKERDIFFVIGGDGPEKNYCESLVSKDVKERILFIGKVSPSVRRLFYEQSDVFVIPSRLCHGCIDIWALTANEALECGTPVISTTDVGSSYDLITEQNGRVVPSNDIMSLKNAIVEILFEKKLYKKREEISKEYIEKYSVNKMVDGFMQTFNSFK